VNVPSVPRFPQVSPGFPGGSIESAANKAKWEGIFMSGFKAGATGNVTLPQVYSGVVTASKLVSVSNSGCK